MKKMPFNPFKRQKTELFLAVDIGSEAVKSLVFSKEDQKISVLGNSLHYFDKFQAFDVWNLKQDIIKKTITKAIEEAKRQAGKEIKGVLLGLPVDILQGKIVSKSYQREKDKEKINEKEEKNICQTVLKDAEKEISQSYAKECGIMPKDLHFLSLKIIAAKIDGYDVPKISGFNGKTIEFKILSTFLPKQYLKNFSEIFDSLNLKILKVFHQAETLFNAFCREEGIFIDVGGEITQIILIKKGQLEMIKQIDMGGRNFSRAISEILGLSEEEGRILKERYSNGELSEGARLKIKEMLSKDLRAWFENLKAVLSKNKFILPSQVFIFGGGSLLPEIEETLSLGWVNTSFVNSPKVKLILPKDLKNISNISEKLNNSQFIPAFLLAYISTTRHE